MNVVQFKSPNTVENKNSGFVMNSRNILKAKWYGNINARLIYLELSLRVTHSTHQTTFNGNNITLLRGQYATKEENLARVIEGTKNQAAYALKVLEKHGVITRFSVGGVSNKCTIITLNLNEKEQSCNKSLNNHVEPQIQKAVSELEIKNKSCNKSVKQEESKTIKDTYVSLVGEVVQLFNETFPNLSSVRKLTTQRKSRLLKIIKDKFQDPNGKPINFKTIDDWNNFFVYMQESDFLMGRSSDWQCSFDWLIDPNNCNFVKTLEGNYENK